MITPIRTAGGRAGRPVIATGRNAFRIEFPSPSIYNRRATHGRRAGASAPRGAHEGDSMARFTAHHVDVRVSVIGLALDDTPLTEFECLSCGHPLSVHQPENGFPERLLGTCESCHNWYLWDF